MICSALNRFPLAISGSFVPGRSSQSTRSKSSQSGHEHFGWGISPDHPPGPTMVSEFSLSMHVTSRRGEETRRTLVDFGFTPQALNNNLRLLDVKPSDLDALVLSHGHYD